MYIYIYIYIYTYIYETKLIPKSTQLLIVYGLSRWGNYSCHIQRERKKL
jgi:hypothetical protein